MNDPTPQYATILRWCEISGMGRTRTYEEAGAGNLRIVKVGSRSLVDVQHGLAWMRSLPNASIKAPRQHPTSLEAGAPDFIERRAAERDRGRNHG